MKAFKMVKENLHLLSVMSVKILVPLLLIGCGVSNKIAGEEFGVVTCEHGYILDESDQILETLQTFAVVDILEEADGMLTVRSVAGTRGKIAVEQLHRSSWFELITPDNSVQIRKALNLIEEAHKGETEDTKSSPVEQMDAGLEIFEKALGKDNTGYAWLLCYKATIQLNEGSPEDAVATLKQAETILTDLDQMESLHAADFHNVTAILAQYNSDFDTAVAEFRKAVEISTEQLGDSHADVGVINANLASAYHDQGELELAIEHQLIAHHIFQAILPADVPERVNSNRAMALYLSSAERYEEAKSHLLEAKEMLEADQSSSLDLLTETVMDVGECYYSLGDNAMARRRLEEVLIAFTENEPLVDIPEDSLRQHFIRLYMLLGLVEQSAARDDVALAHFEKSLSYAVPSEPDSLVARSAEEAGITAARLNRSGLAKKYYEQAISLYTELEGAESQNVVNVTELMASLSKEMQGPKPSDDEPAEYVLVTASHGYLTDRDGKVVVKVPALSMLRLLGAGEDTYSVYHDEQEFQIQQGLVRRGELLPSHGVLSDEEAKPFYDKLAKARQLQHDGDLPAAHGAFISVIDELSRKVGVNNPFYVLISCNIAICAAQQGGLDIAEQILDRQADYLKQLDEQKHPVLFEVLATLSYIRLLEQQYDEAASLMQKAVAIQNANGLQETAEATVPLHVFVAIDLQTGKFDSALKRQENIMSIVSRAFPPASFEHAAARAGLGMTKLMTDPNSDGLQLLEEAVETARTLNEPLDRVTELQISYGLFLKFFGHTEDAKQQLQSALRNVSGPDKFLMISSKLNALTELADIAVSEAQYDDAIRIGEEGFTVIESARKQYSIGKTMTAQIATRLHEVLIVGYENAGDSAAAKRHSDRLKELTAEIAAQKLSNASSDANLSKTQPPRMQKDSPSDKSPNETATPVVPNGGEANTLSPFELTPPHEFMLVTTQSTSIHESPNGPVLLSLPKNRRVWSLESVDGWSRVRIPGKEGFGWVQQQHGVEQNAMLLQTLMQNRLTEASKNNLDTESLGKKAEEVLLQMEQARQRLAARDSAGALSLFESAVAGSREVLGQNNPLSTMISTEMAQAYMVAGQFSKARTLLEETLPITRKTMGENHPRAAVDAWRLASLLNMIADLRGATEQLETAIRIAEFSYGADDVRTQMFRLDLANLRTQQGQLDQAEELLNEILTALDRHPTTGSPNPLRVRATAALGVIAFDRENYEESLKLSSAAETQYAALGEQFRLAQRNIQVYRGFTLFRLGKFQEAEEVFRDAEADLASSADSVAGMKIRLSMMNSTIAFLKGDINQSLELIEVALQESVRVYGEDHISNSSLRAYKAHALAAQGKIAESQAEFQASRESVFKYVNETLADLPVRQQTAFLKHQDKNLLNRAISLSLRPDAGASDHELTATWLLNARNLPHELSSRSGQVRRLLKSKPQIDSYERYREARERLATMPSGYANAEELAFREDELSRQRDIMQSAFDSLPVEAQQQIRVQSADYVPISEVQKRLQQDETLVEIIRMTPVGFSPEETAQALNPSTRSAEEYVAWIIPPANNGAAPDQAIQVVRLGKAAEIDEQVAAIQNTMLQSIKAIKTEGHALATESVLAACERLATDVWAPIQTALNGRSKVILSPDGELWRAPWTAFPVGDNRMLVEDFELRFLVSGRELLRKKPENLALSAPLILADPDYDASENVLRDALRELFPGTSRQRRVSGNLDTDSLRATLTHRAKRLPGTAIEANAVVDDVRRLASQEPSVFLRAQASEESFRRTERPYSVMFSTHGFFLPQEKLRESPLDDTLAVAPGSAASLGDAADPLMRCGLLLAGCNQRETKNSNSDGILLGREIVEIDLRGTKLVVLSACETGLGDVADGLGIAGLRQAFQLAGAESVVSTLWSIEDKETSRLMTEFFGQLSSGETKPAALRQAQLNRIAALRERNGAAHPFFWAAFTVTGEK